MSDEKPLRPEDYRALAEEARRLKAENEKLKARKPFNWRLFRRLALVSCIPGVVMLVYLAGARACDAYEKYEKAHPPKQRCYFPIQHTHREEGPLPWDPWHIGDGSTDCSECSGAAGDSKVCHESACSGFTTYEEAEAFIKRWNLPRCK